MKSCARYIVWLIIALSFSLNAQATLVNLSGCTGANACTITTSPPNPIQANPNNGILLAWDERQNITLTDPLLVDRVFDENASFVSKVGSDIFLNAGTIVSSHYLQWDPGNGSAGNVQATIELDSQVFAFITATQNLFDTDALLGLPGLDYADFGLRGLESNDSTQFIGSNTAINWSAGSPGDWTRLITAFSPGATAVPVPAAVWLFGTALVGLVGFGRRRRAA